MAGKQEHAKRARRQFTDEFKAGAVRLVLDEGKKISATRDLAQFLRVPAVGLHPAVANSKRLHEGRWNNAHLVA